jgi:PelA/Pel-15E family pectate lyase
MFGNSKILFFATILLITWENNIIFAQKDILKSIDISGFEDDIRHWKNGGGKGMVYDQFSVDQITEIGDNLLKFQNPDGGWPKNIDWLGKLDYDVVWERLSNFERKSTCDNRNTYTQIEYLSKVYTVTLNAKYRDGAARGLTFILETQNESGGWRGSDVDAITFNDDLMTGIMNLFLDIIEGRQYYSWIGKDLKIEIEESFRRAVDVTLKCQIVVNGKRTGWCQQHDHKTLLPVKARSYELPSIASLETTSVVEFLMRFDKPDQKIIDAINGAIAWLVASKIYGIRLERIEVDSRNINENYKRYDVIAVEDKNASPVWARYYEIETNQPFFCNRDGIKVYKLEDVDQERRIGYAWYGYWPAPLLNSKYPDWFEKISTVELIDFPRDTSYTIYSTYDKLITEYPFIKIVEFEIPKSVAFEKDVVYKSIDNRKLHLDLFYPKEYEEQFLPAVLLIHGGGWKSGNKSLISPMAVKLAESGYVTATIEYRLSPEAKFPAAIYDIKSAIMWIKQNSYLYNIDTNKIALLGCSAGGTLAVFVGSASSIYNPNYENFKATANVKAIIDVDGILDFTHPAESGKDTVPENPSAGKLFLGSSYKENPQIWIDASPLTYIDAQAPPLFFINSAIDRFHAGRNEAIKILLENNIYYEVHTIPNAPHSFWLFEPWFDDTIHYTIKFLHVVFD